MKKLTLESFFHPEVPGPRNQHHYRNDKVEKSPNNFPYTEINSDENLSDEEIAKLLKLEFFLGNTTPHGRDLTILRKADQGQSWNGGKGTKSFSNYLTKQNDESQTDKDKTRAVSVDFMNYSPDEDFDIFKDNEQHSDSDLSENMGRDPGQFHTRNISTKQPFANGLPRGEDEEKFHMYLNPEEDLSDLEIEDELELSLESLFEYGQRTNSPDTALSILNQGYSSKDPKADLDFFDKISDDNKYVMVPEEEFEVDDEQQDE